MEVGAGAPTRAPRFGLLLGLIALLAFALREHFVLTAIVDVPIRGDIRDYVSYAFNLVTHGVYSGTYPPAEPVPDAYRLPGYPFLIALGMVFFPQETGWNQLGGWYSFVLQAQVLMGTATTVLVVLTARHWVSATWAIFAGGLVALWPHHVVATGALLSEVMFGFFLMLACYAFARAWESQRVAWFVVAGVAFGYAYLVNPLVLLFPPCLAAMAWWLGSRRGAAWMLAAFLVPVFAFALRGATLPATGQGSSARATINLVQGAWPEYHVASNWAMVNHANALATMAAIQREIDATIDDPAQGLSMMRARMARDPAHYARWYLLDKPWLLWNWNVQIGWGHIYVLGVRNSPYQRSASLHATMRAYRALNPAFTLVALGAALGLLCFGWRRSQWVPAAAIGALVVYFTLMHMVLQAEPRYATAYRPLEAILIATALAWLASLLPRRAPGHSGSVAPAE